MAKLFDKIRLDEKVIHRLAKNIYLNSKWQ